MISTILYDTHSREMAFSVGGQIEWERIDRACFEEACKEIGLNKRLFMARLDEMDANFDRALSKAAGTMDEEGFDEAEEMAARIREVRNAAVK